MSGIFVHGLGAVSSAGWGVTALRDALASNVPLPTSTLVRPACQIVFTVRTVPPPPERPEFLAHPRLRRASAIAQHIVAAALEALGDDVGRVQAGALRLGVVVCLMSGGVAYTRRFCEEMFKDPATASPLIFPETVFNAPASHLASYLGSNGINYTLVGDEGMFLQGLALGANWLVAGAVDGCVVVGGEELDWIVADAMRLFDRGAIHSAGAGAVYLKRGALQTGEASEMANGKWEIELAGVTDSFSFTSNETRATAARQMKAQLQSAQARQSGIESVELLCLGTKRFEDRDPAELAAWKDWSGPRLAPKQILGEAFAASSAWQCVVACEALRRGDFSASNVSVVGVNQQAIGARFVSVNSRS